MIAVPLMPTLSLAVLVLLLRFSTSQMDVPTRQSYTMAVVEASERSAAGGFTRVASTSGAAISPLLAGFLFARPGLINLPFYIAGTLKVVYDLLLFLLSTTSPAGGNCRRMKKHSGRFVLGRNTDQRSSCADTHPRSHWGESGFSQGWTRSGCFSPHSLVDRRDRSRSVKTHGFHSALIDDFHIGTYVGIAELIMMVDAKPSWAALYHR